MSSLTQSLNQNVSSLTQRLDNKVEKTDKTIYKQLQDVSGAGVDILEYAKNLKKSGFFQLSQQNKNVPTTGLWDFAFAEIIYYNDRTIHLKINCILPPYSVAKNNYINGSWSGWTVV